LSFFLSKRFFFSVALRFFQFGEKLILYFFELEALFSIRSKKKFNFTPPKQPSMSEPIQHAEPTAKPAEEPKEPKKRAPRKRKVAEDGEQPKKRQAKQTEEPKAAPQTPRSASSNPKAHEAACKDKRERIVNRYLKFLNSTDLSNVKMTRRLDRKTVEQDGVRVLAFGQSICEHELRFLTQKYGTAPPQPTKRKSGYMNFTKIMRAKWAKKPEYMNVDKKNPNGSKAIVSDIAKAWKSLSAEERERYTNMADEDLDARIAELVVHAGLDTPAHANPTHAEETHAEPQLAM
jgi:hypothetical protein